MLSVFGVLVPRDLLTVDELSSLDRIKKWRTVSRNPTIRVVRGAEWRGIGEPSIFVVSHHIQSRDHRVLIPTLRTMLDRACRP